MNDKYQGKYKISSARAQWWDYSGAGAYFITICTAGRFPYFGYITNGVMNYSETGIIAKDYWYQIKNHAKNVKLGVFVIMPNHIHGIIEIVKNDPVSGDSGGSDVSGGSGGSGGSDVTDVAGVAGGSGGSDVTDVAGGFGVSDVAGVTDVAGGFGVSDVAGVTDVAGVETRHALSLQWGSLEQRDSLVQWGSLEQRGSLEQQPESPDQSGLHGKSRFRNPGKNTISTIIGGYKSAVSRECKMHHLEFAWQARFHDHIIRNESEYNRIMRYIENNPINWKTDTFNDR